MPLTGMTGFARSEGALGAWSWGVEARSVNGRNLETRYRGPPGFDALERFTREAAQARFSRGQVAVNLQAKRAESAGRVRINLAEIERLLAAADPYVASGRAAPPRFDGLLAVRGVLEAAEDGEDPEAAAVEAGMSASITQALDGLLSARREEGAALAGVLGGFVGGIERLVQSAEAEARTVPEVVKTRLAQRIRELVGEPGDRLDERIVQEAALAATKADVREELDRLSAHVAAARVLLSGEAAAGRRLDFLTQEFMREANTLCAKAATPRLTAIGLELKAIIDQFREQVQNVE